MPIMTLEELQKQLNIKKSSAVSDIKEVINAFLNRQDIDMITRIRDTELDKICNMLHHTHGISIILNNAFISELGTKYKKEIYIPVICSGERYVLQNLSLRLSLNSESRKELENVFISLIKNELDMVRETDEKQEDK